jgi:hypothetical protein
MTGVGADAVVADAIDHRARDGAGAIVRCAQRHRSGFVWDLQAPLYKKNTP